MSLAFIVRFVLYRCVLKQRKEIVRVLGGLFRFGIAQKKEKPARGGLLETQKRVLTVVVRRRWRGVLLGGQSGIAALGDGLLGVVGQFLRLGEQLQRLRDRRIILSVND